MSMIASTTTFTCKMSMIEVANTVVYPRTMVVHLQHTPDLQFQFQGIPLERASLNYFAYVFAQIVDKYKSDSPFPTSLLLSPGKLF